MVHWIVSVHCGFSNTFVLGGDVVEVVDIGGGCLAGRDLCIRYKARWGGEDVP